MCEFESKEYGRCGIMCKFESKEVCESLRFDSKFEWTGWRKLVVWDGVCGAGAAWLRRMARLILGIVFLWKLYKRSFIGECICRVLDALAGEFKGCRKESSARHIIGECNYGVLDTLVGEFRGYHNKNTARLIIGECNCRVLDTLSGEFRGCGQESNVWFQ